jgi:hypothetical protein
MTISAQCKECGWVSLPNSSITHGPNCSLDNSAKTKASGLDNDYWLIDIAHPKRLEPYKVECEDIIEAMNMPFAEATVFKSLWRLCQLRAGNGKPGSTEQYEAEKMVYYSDRTLAKVKNK